jgi:DUF4097 and DUF4098 domain-containing protein YvlB
MNGVWRAVMCAGVLAVVQPGGVDAAPWLATPDAGQPAPPAPPTRVRMRVEEQTRERDQARDAETRARDLERDAQNRERDADARGDARAAAQARAQARAAAQARRDAGEARREIERNQPWTSDDQGPIVRLFRGGEGFTLDLMNKVGDVVVVGGKGREGKLTVIRRIQGTGPEAERLLREMEVEVAEHANRIAVRTMMPRRDGRPYVSKARIRTDYEIALPAGTALELKNLQGNVRLSNVPGDVRVEAVAGDVVAEAMSRVRLLRSMSGDVTLSRSTLAGDANLQTVSGDVIAQAVKAGSLTLGSVSGTVHVRESTSERALIRTVSGNIEFAGAPRRAGRYEFKTHAGDIFVFAPSGPGFEFEASSFKGDVHSDVPTQPMAPGTRQVRGSVGDGSAFFDLFTFTGDIKVGKKEPKEKP